MALTGTLLADFSAFIRESATATTAVKGLEQSGDDAAKKLSQLSTGVDLKKAITDPMATATEAAKSFGAGLVDSFGATGIAIAGMTAVGGVLGEKLIEIGTEAEHVGQQIGRLGVMFNVPVGPLSDLRFAITAAGGDFDAFGQGLFTFQKRIEDNGDAVGKGLEKIGLSLESIRGMRPDEQFLAISDAIRGTSGETNKAAVAFEIFGKQGKDMLPLLLKPLSDLTEESEKLGATWTDTDVAAARAFGAEMNKMGAETEEAWTSVGRTIAPVTNDIVEGWARMKLAAANVALTAVESFQVTADALRHLAGSTGDLEVKQQESLAVQSAVVALYKEAAAAGLDYAAQTEQVAKKMLEMGYSHQTVATQLGLTKEAVRELASEQRNATKDAEEYAALWADITKKFNEGKPTLEGVSAATRGLAADLLELGTVPLPKIAAATGLTIGQLQLLKTDLDKGATATKEWKTATENVAAAQAGWQATLDTMDGTVVEAIKYALSMGATQADVAKSFGVTAAQVGAAKISLEDYITALNNTAEFEKTAAARRIEITHQMTAAINDQIVATLKAKQADADFLAGALKTAQSQDAAQQALTTSTKSQLQQRADAAKAAYDSAYTDASTSQEKIEALGRAWTAAQKAANEEAKGSAVGAATAIGGAYGEAFTKSAAMFESFKGVVVAGTGEMVASIGALNDASTNAGAWAERQRKMFEDQMARGTPFVVTGGGLPPMQTRDSGGPVTAGTSYVIGGGREPELFTPGASGFVTPGAAAAGGGGRGVVVNNVFNIVDTEAGITRRVSDNITRSIMAAQKL